MKKQKSLYLEFLFKNLLQVVNNKMLTIHLKSQTGYKIQFETGDI